ncbi:MAG: alpha/beta hydrolase [Solirubrobacterales bacterium]|nr:alpha/beta hydrolase [Solirubrobacterales bacterium]
MACLTSLRTGLALALVLAGLGSTASSQATAAEPARTVPDVNYNLDELAPPESWQNSLDLYLPAIPDGAGSELRPVVIYVHGGGLMIGDKSNRMPDKVSLFNGLGYIFASVNYRLSPDITDGDLSDAFAPGRVRAPDHLADVAEAVAWISRNIRRYGGDPDRLILIGHSSGGQMVNLVGTNPAWVRGRWMSPAQILGVVSLDSDTFDVRSEADPATSTASFSRRTSFWQVFGTPAEEAADPRWDSQSPLLSADPSDPPFLFITQSARPARIASSSEMASKLGQDPDTSVVPVPYDHDGINTALGSAGDSSQETARVSQFMEQLVNSAGSAGVRITRRPAGRVVVKVKRRATRKATKKAMRNVRRKVAFRFEGKGRARGLQCRIDGAKFSRCRSPKSYRLKPGKHTFRVRALYPSGRPGDERKLTFRIVARVRR